MVMDTATAKALLGSCDKDAISEAVTNAQKDWETPGQDAALRGQLVKLQLLLLNRLSQLSADDDAAHALVHRRTAQVWKDQASDCNRAAGQFKQAATLGGAVEDWTAAGDCYLREADYAHATECHQKAVDTSDDKAAPLGRLAATYEAASEFDKAQESLTEALGLASDDAELLAQKGTLLEKMGMYKEAAESLKKAVDALTALHGADHARTQEVAFLLEMAESLA